MTSMILRRYINVMHMQDEIRGLGFPLGSAAAAASRRRDFQHRETVRRKGFSLWI